MPVIGMTGTPAGPAGPLTGTAFQPPEPGKAAPAEIVAGAAANQLCGTDSAPIVAPRPRPAATVDPPGAAQPAELRPPPSIELSPPPSPEPDAFAPLSAALAAGISDFPVEITEVIVEPHLAQRCGSVVIVVNIFCTASGRAVVDGKGDAASCNAIGTVDVNCDKVAWVYTTNPAGLVVGGGEVNGVTFEAAAEVAA